MLKILFFGNISDFSGYILLKTVEFMARFCVNLLYYYNKI